MKEKLKELWASLDAPLFSDYFTIKRCALIAAVILAAVVMLIPSPSKAAEVSRVENITFFDGDCPAKVLKHIPAEDQKLYSLATVDMAWKQGPVLKACWVIAPNPALSGMPMYFIVDEQGDSGFVPLN